MRHVRLLVILLVVATLLVDLVVLSAVVGMHPLVPPDWPNPAAIALFALCMAQVGLVAIWTGFGGKSLPWRVLGLVLTIGLWSRLAAWVTERSGHFALATHWSCLLLGYGVAILVPLWAARLQGVRPARVDGASPSPPAAHGRGRLQFSLGYMLSWITVLTVMLGLAQYALEAETLVRVLTSYWWELPLFSVSHGVLVLASLWAAMGTARFWGRSLAVVAATALTIVANHLWTGVGETGPYAAFCVLQLLWVIASLSVFRVAGYRLTRAPRPHAEEPSTSPDVG